MSDTSPLKNVLQQMIEQYKMKDAIEAERVKNIWAKVVGPHVTKYTESIQLKNHQLIVHITSDSLRDQMNYAKKQLINNLNTEIGYQYLREVWIK